MRNLIAWWREWRRPKSAIENLVAWCEMAEARDRYKKLFWEDFR